MGRFRLFMSILARDNPIDGGGSCRVLNASNMEDAKAEARAIIAERAPEDDCDFVCDFAAVVEVASYEEIVKISK